MFLRNQWYVAATTKEIGRALLARKILGEPLILYRTAAGAPVAMEDRCPHRAAPLSRGKLIGDVVQCPYHGMDFAPDGKCTHIPGQESIPPRLKARTFPMAEKHGWAWIWMGDAAKADPALIHDYHWNEEPGWEPVFGYTHVNAEYRLVVDNLMDLTHETFVHPTSIGQTAVAETPITTTMENGKVKVSRLMPGIPAPPLFAKLRGLTTIDRWQHIYFDLPAHVRIDAGGVPADTKDRARGLNWMVQNAMTPETERSTHYFWAISRCFEVGDAAVSRTIHGQITNIFQEDCAILEEQQKRLDNDPLNRPLLATNCDAGSVAARKMIDQALAREAQAQAAE
ncbi:MAG: aromatic ring-hydroxylating dioxygenase subunit alpha [Candidatus Odyssella sp.]|nr:aromatic ring-hydroxylating dioxygenase subunit alpha [Candidatus Odyssella sp.]